MLICVLILVYHPKYTTQFILCWNICFSIVVAGQKKIISIKGSLKNDAFKQ